MNQSFYAASVAMSQHQQRLSVTGNNMANVNTLGFKAEKSQFADLMYRNLTGPDNAQLPRGTGSRLIQTATDFTQGSLMARDGGQNYGIEGRGFFALRDPQTNEISYTRAGAFHWGSTTRGNQTVYHLCDDDGHYVLNQNYQPITMTGDADDEYPVGIFDFANTDDMRHVGSNRLMPVPKNGAPMAGEGTVIKGVVESSNTDIASEFSKIIEAQRSFSYALKLLQTQDDITTTINGLRA